MADCQVHLFHDPEAFMLCCELRLDNIASVFAERLICGLRSLSELKVD